MEEEFIIPMDDEIKSFHQHLNSHDRTILSAKFGDGKSFFLSHFMDAEEVKERYTFLTIFPVNYQVVENRDIFDLIKRDILLQMFIKSVIDTGVEISDGQALALYLQCKPLSFFESFLPLITELAPSGEAKIAISVAQAFKKLVTTFKSRLDDIKSQSQDNQIETFLNEVEQNPIVGQDIISSIIQQGIEKYKQTYPNKRVALIIEDMDRIDPAHLFRILNVFSAHIDYCYHIGIQPDKTLTRNKFGLDKVIFVLDYDNLSNIYHHFYGSKTSFEGYIEKFCSSNHYDYSLKEQCSNYYMQRIGTETGLEDAILKMLVKPVDFNNKPIRSVVNAIERTDDFLFIECKGKNFKGEEVSIHSGILRMIAILRKLGVKDTIIIDRIKDAIIDKDSYHTTLFNYLAPYFSFLTYGNAIGAFKFTNSDEMTILVNVQYIEDNGKAVCNFSHVSRIYNDAESQLLELLQKLLSMVAK